MRLVSQLLVASAFTTLAATSAIIPREAALDSYTSPDAELWRRTTPQAPNGYAPAAVECPSARPTIRLAHGLSDNETAWLKTRRSNTLAPMREFLLRMNISGFHAGDYIDKYQDDISNIPNIAIAFSGGGYRALTNGAGALAAFDNRTPNSTNTGQIGGLLQASTYIAGLSGGGWLVGSIYSNNFTSVQAIIDEGDNGVVWQFGNTIFEGPKESGIQILNSVEYYKNLVDSVNSKVDAGLGFNASLTDYWGRALSFQLVNASEGGPAYTFSSIQDDPDFKNANAPMPILLADERAPGQTIVSLNATNIEINPFEIGSFDPTLYGFAPTRYIGSNFTGGSIGDDQKCVAGFDNAGFMMGTSSTLFNQIILNLNTISGIPDIVTNALKDVLSVIGDDDDDIADYSPNPFYNFNSGSNPSANTKRLTLVDGGEDLQNIPLNPLIQPVRNVDVIFAVDSSADFVDPTDSAQNWPNGTALQATYERSTNATIQNGTVFPSIPDTNTFINLGLNNRPTFFGCDASNLTGPTPLIVYLPNAPYVYNSNTSTYQMEYTNEERNAIIENGYNVATQGNGTIDSSWPTCVGCAILSRSFNRTDTQVPYACKQCFKKYCWDGTINSTTPAPYFPEMKLQAIKVSSAGNKHHLPNFLSSAFAAAATAFLML